MQNYTITERLKLTLANIKHQQNLVLWDDLEKLEEVIERVQELEKQIKSIRTAKKRRNMEIINLNR